MRIAEPILKAAVAHFQNNASVQAYALEISHHVLGKVGGVAVERPENLVIVLPQAAAIRLATANDDSARQLRFGKQKALSMASPRQSGSVEKLRSSPSKARRKIRRQRCQARLP